MTEMDPSSFGFQLLWMNNTSLITNKAEAIAPTLRAGQLVVLESTTYPGTTEQVLVPILEKGKKAASFERQLALRMAKSCPRGRSGSKFGAQSEPPRTQLARPAVARERPAGKPARWSLVRK